MRIRAVLAIITPLLLASCVGNIATPTASLPATTPVPISSSPATSSPSVAPTQSPPVPPPFASVVPLPAQPAYIAFDRGRVAYIPDTGELVVVDIVTGAARTVHRPQQGWHLELDVDGLRADTLVFLETRTDGQRTDVRVRQVDLRFDAMATLDDFSGPFLGGGDTWRPRAPVTNGVTTAWIRVDQDRAPFGIHVVLQLPVQGGPRAIDSGTSAVWIDLDDRNGVAISKLITSDHMAELVLWQDGQRTSLGTRPSEDGGPVFFVDGGIFWQQGPGIVAHVETGAHIILPRGVIKTIDFRGCGITSPTLEHLVLVCRDGAALLRPTTGVRTPLPPGSAHRGVGRAVVWRGDGTTQWWLGILRP